MELLKIFIILSRVHNIWALKRGLEFSSAGKYHFSFVL